jgi:hypothetical protein
MPSPSALFTELTAITLRSQKRRVTDQITANNAFYRALRDRGNIVDDVKGGDSIVEAITLVPSAIQNYSGYQPYSTSAVQNISAVKFNWVQKVGTVSASGRELRINKGKEALIKLVTAKTTAMLDSASNTMNIELFSDGSADQSIGGLQLLLQANGTGTVGAIDSSVWSAWQNKYVQQTALSGSLTRQDLIYTDMTTLWKKCVFGSDKPDLGFMTHDYHTAFEASQQVLQRYMDPKKATAGFENVGFKGIPIMFDSNANFSETGQKLYLLNTKHIYLVEHPDAKWDMEPERKPVNQDAVNIPAYWMGALVIKSRRTQGLLSS